MNAPIQPSPSVSSIPTHYMWEDLQKTLRLSSPAPHEGTTSRPKKDASGETLSISELMQRRCKDGERTSHLLRLAGALFAKGFSLDDCIGMCGQWNAQNVEPLPIEKIETTCASLQLTDLRNHPDRNSVKTAPTARPFFDLADGRIDQFLSTRPPDRRWLLKDLLTLGKSAAIIAPGGSSKSQWLLQLAVGVATGIPVADHWEIGETGSVLMFCAEDDNDEIHRRLDRIGHHLQMSGKYAELNGVEHRLFVFSTIGREMLLTKRSLIGEVLTTEVVDNIANLAAKLPDLKLIILDPAARFRGGEENSNEDATRFVEALEGLGLATGATVMIAHHTNKASQSADVGPNQGASRGASGLTDGLRWQMNLSPASEPLLSRFGLPTDKLRQYVVATVTKTNYSAFPEPVLLERLEGGYLSAVSPQAAKSRQDMAAIMAVLAAITCHGKPITSRRLEEAYAGHHKALKMPKERMRVAVHMAIERGLLTGGSRKALSITPSGESALQQAPVSIVKDDAAAGAPLISKKPSRKNS
jgi:hypothetical protein